MKCIECEEYPATEIDPREPPLDLDDCLCRSCAADAWEEQREELIYQLEQACQNLGRLGRDTGSFYTKPAPVDLLDLLRATLDMPSDAGQDDVIRAITRARTAEVDSGGQG